MFGSFSSLECGFVSWRGGLVSAVDSCDLQLAYHAEGGLMPKNYGFTFTAGATSGCSTHH